MKDLYVVNCCRTAIGSFGGSLKNTPAAEMGAVVVKEALKRANINTVEDLISKTEDDMMKVRNLGRKSLEEVINKLAMMGLSLASEDNN